MKKKLAVLLTSAILGTILTAGCGNSDGPTATLRNSAGTTLAVPADTAPGITSSETETGGASSVSAEPSLDDVLEAVDENADYTKVDTQDAIDSIME